MNDFCRLILILHQTAHADGLQGVKEKVRINLALQSVQLRMPPLKLQILLLNIRHVHVIDQALKRRVIRLNSPVS